MKSRSVIFQKEGCIFLRRRVRRESQSLNCDVDRFSLMNISPKKILHHVVMRLTEKQKESEGTKSDEGTHGWRKAHCTCAWSCFWALWGLTRRGLGAKSRDGTGQRRGVGRWRKAFLRMIYIGIKFLAHVNLLLHGGGRVSPARPLYLIFLLTFATSRKHLWRLESICDVTGTPSASVEFLWFCRGVCWCISPLNNILVLDFGLLHLNEILLLYTYRKKPQISILKSKWEMSMKNECEHKLDTDADCCSSCSFCDLCSNHQQNDGEKKSSSRSNSFSSTIINFSFIFMFNFHLHLDLDFKFSTRSPPVSILVL